MTARFTARGGDRLRPLSRKSRVGMQWSCGGFDDEADMYVSRDTTPANDADLDFIANARQDIPV